jgi:hypothetical protein
MISKSGWETLDCPVAFVVYQLWCECATKKERTTVVVFTPATMVSANSLYLFHSQHQNSVGWARCEITKTEINIIARHVSDNHVVRLHQNKYKPWLGGISDKTFVGEQSDFVCKLLLTLVLTRRSRMLHGLENLLGSWMICECMIPFSTN